MEAFKERITMKDDCVNCGEEAPYWHTDHLDLRKFYVEGAGQLCSTCWEKIFDDNE